MGHQCCLSLKHWLEYDLYVLFISGHIPKQLQKSKYTEVTIQTTGQLFENQKIMISALCLSLNSDIHSNIVLKYTSRFIISGYPLVLK